MSKAALQKIADEIKSTTAKTIRESFLNRQTHVFSIDQDSIADEIAAEISYRDDEAAKKDPSHDPLLNKIEPYMFDDGASRFYNYLTAQSKLARFFDSRTKVFTVSNSAGTYRLISDELTKASKIVIDMIEAKVGKTTLSAGHLIQFDHTYAVANIRTAYALSRSKKGQGILDRLLKDQRISEEDYDIYSGVLSYYKAGDKVLEFTTQVVQGSLESGGVNASRGNTIELSRRGAILRAMDKLILSKDLTHIQSSDSYRDYLIKRINNAAVKAGASGMAQAFQIAANSAKSSGKTKAKVKNEPLPRSGTRRKVRTQKVSTKQLSLMQLINAKLRKTMIANMGPETLVNRTGRLASSAKLVAERTTAQGYRAFDYTYQRSPYDVFDPTLGKQPWNTPSRNPKALIEKSVREIAAEYTRERFYLRRV